MGAVNIKTQGRLVAPAKQIRICGLDHKIGTNGFVFMKVNGEWVKSAKPAQVVQSLFDAKGRNKNERSKSWCR